MSKPMLVTAEDRTDTLLQALSKAGYLDDDWRVERDDGDGRSKAENLTLAEFRKALAAAWKAGQDSMRARAFKVCQGEVRVYAEDAGPDENPTDRVAFTKKKMAAWLMNTILALPVEPAPPVGLES